MMTRGRRTRNRSFFAVSEKWLKRVLRRTPRHRQSGQKKGKRKVTDIFLFWHYQCRIYF
jgi:hypothetical protein